MGERSRGVWHGLAVWAVAGGPDSISLLLSSALSARISTLVAGRLTSVQQLPAHECDITYTCHVILQQRQSEQLRPRQLIQLRDSLQSFHLPRHLPALPPLAEVPHVPSGSSVPARTNPDIPADAPSAYRSAPAPHACPHARRSPTRHRGRPVCACRQEACPCTPLAHTSLHYPSLRGRERVPGARRRLRSAAPRYPQGARERLARAQSPRCRRISTC